MNNQDSHCRCGTDGEQVNRNSVLPTKIPGGVLIILRDGDPG